jgi:cytoskeleton protein RodZ
MSQPTIGERLRRAREERGASLYEVSRDTKIRVDFLDHMERDNFRFISGHAYIRGLVRSYARWVDLDVGEITSDFDESYGVPEPPAMRHVIREPAQLPPKRRPYWAISAAVAAVILVGLALIGVMKPVGPSQIAEAPTPDEVAPTVASEEPAGRAEEVAEAPPQYEGVHVTLAIADARCWVSVVIDGARAPAFERVLEARDVQTFRGDELVGITIGNLGAVNITVNGRDLGVPGAPGQVGTFLFRPDTDSFAKT